MKPEEAAMVQQAAALVAANLRQDDEGTELLLADLMNQERGPDSFILLSIVAAESWSLTQGGTPGDFWQRLDGPAAWLPAEQVDRSAAVALATAVKAGDGPAIDTASARLGDVATVLLSAFDLALAAVTELARATGVEPAVWCQQWALGAAANIGVEEE